MAAEEPRAPLVRPEFGPTLPALVRRRLGVPERVTVAVVLGLGLAAAVGLLVARWVATVHGEVVVHRTPPVFTLVYDPDVLHRAAPRAGELVRLEAGRGALAVSVVARAFRLPAYRGDVSRGQLPLYADRYADALRRELPGFRLRVEGRARVNDYPGYQLGFRAASGGRPTFGRDLLLVARERDVREGVAVSLRQRLPGGTLTDAQLRTVDAAKEAFKSLGFGTEPAS